MIVCHFLLGVCCYMGFLFVAQQRGDSLHIETDSTHSLVTLNQVNNLGTKQLVVGLTNFDQQKKGGLIYGV
jgi:hypothetical protein